MNIRFINIRFIAVILTLLLLPTAAAAQPPEQPKQPKQPKRMSLVQEDRPQPEDTVRAFLQAFTQGNISDMWKYVLGAKEGQRLPEDFSQMPYHIRFKVIDSDTLQEGNQAYVNL